jgi:hypothetical protein
MRKSDRWLKARAYAMPYLSEALSLCGYSFLMVEREPQLVSFPPNWCSSGQFSGRQNDGGERSHKTQPALEIDS